MRYKENEATKLSLKLRDIAMWVLIHVKFLSREGIETLRTHTDALMYTHRCKYTHTHTHKHTHTHTHTPTHTPTHTHTHTHTPTHTHTNTHTHQHTHTSTHTPTHTHNTYTHRLTKCCVFTTYIYCFNRKSVGFSGRSLWKMPFLAHTLHQQVMMSQW